MHMSIGYLEPLVIVITCMFPASPRISINDRNTLVPCSVIVGTCVKLFFFGSMEQIICTREIDFWLIHNFLGVQ